MKKLLLLMSVSLLALSACTKDENDSSENNNSENNESVDGEIYTGRTTVYSETSIVATGITKIPSGLYKCAMHQDNLDQDGIEGACVEITGPAGTIKAVVVDCLPNTDVLGDGSGTVKKNHIDIMGTEAFQKLTGATTGIFDITWKIVALPVSDPIIYYIKDGTSQWWIGIRLQYQKYPVKKIEIKINGSYVAMERETTERCYNLYKYQTSGTQITVPVEVRLTDIYGDVIEDKISSIAADTYVNGTTNF